ncbi:MAG: hypothetical protein OXR73_06230 [Myxococcales bacterium]|nr:hypothetical protein [Myxococcales bacterium]
MRHNELMRCEQPSGAWAPMIASMLLSVCLLAGCMTDGTVYRNFTPEANAGEDQQMDFPGSPVQITLDGSGSTDTDGSIAKYIWRPGFLGAATDAGAPAQLGSPDPEDRVNPTIMLGEGVWQFVLWVEDNDGAVSDPDVVEITIGTPAACRPTDCTPSTGVGCCTGADTGAMPGDPRGRGPDLCGTDLGMLSAALAGVCLQTDQPGAPSDECPEIMGAVGPEPGCCTDEGLCGSVSGLLGCHYPQEGPGDPCTAP